MLFLQGRKLYLAVTGAVVLIALVLSGFAHGLSSKRYEQHRYETTVPMLSITTTQEAIPGELILDERGKSVGYTMSKDNLPYVTGRLETPDGASRDITLHVRGNSSRRFSKSSYRMNLIENGDPLTERKEELLGMPESDEWVLYGPYLDKTLMRNYMWMNISAQVLGWAPQVRFCELTLNGTYRGLYVLMETIGVSEHKISLHEYRPGDPVMSYMVHIETRTDEDVTIMPFSFYSKRLEPRKKYAISYPTRKNQTAAVQQYIYEDLSEIENAIFASNAATDEDFYVDYLDEDSFVDYYILQEFLAGSDTFNGSTYFYKDARGKLHIGPVWDFNNVLDNYFTTLEAEGFLLSDRNYYGQLMKSERFVNRVIDRYRALRRGVLSDAYLERYVEDVDAFLGEAIDRNFDVWADSLDYTKLPPHERRTPSAGSGLTLQQINPSSHEEATQQMLTYARERGEWLDEHIESLRQYCNRAGAYR